MLALPKLVFIGAPLEQTSDERDYCNPPGLHRISINQARTLVYRPDKNRRVGRVVLQPDLHQIAARQRTNRLIAALCQASL